MVDHDLNPIASPALVAVADQLEVGSGVVGFGKITRLIVASGSKLQGNPPSMASAGEAAVNRAAVHFGLFRLLLPLLRAPRSSCTRHGSHYRDRTCFPCPVLLDVVGHEQMDVRYVAARFLAGESTVDLVNHDPPLQVKRLRHRRDLILFVADPLERWNRAVASRDSVAGSRLPDPLLPPPAPEPRSQNRDR